MGVDRRDAMRYIIANRNANIILVGGVLLQNRCGKEPGNLAVILKGPYAGHTGRVLDFFQEQDNDGIPIADGLRGHTLEIENVGRRAFWSGEIQINR